MLLRRLGNKQGIADKILQHFPQHQIYIEPFFGAGGMYFNKPRAHNNILNDIDSDVFNLFMVVSNNKQELSLAFKEMPYHQDLLKHWVENKETDKIKKALRFLFLSNFSYLGKQDTIALCSARLEYQYRFDEYLENAHKLVFGVQFGNMDFRKFLKSIAFYSDGRDNEGKTLIYADPPYLNQTSTYTDNGWSEKDSNDLFETLKETGCKWAMSEFSHPFIIEQAKTRNLNLITIGERQNLKNRRTEILITNYENAPTLFS
jgi:DNA adenine methylase